MNAPEHEIRIETDDDLQRVDRECEEAQVRDGFRAARTEDEALEALRSAGSLGAGMRIVSSLPPWPYDPGDPAWIENQLIAARQRTAAEQREAERHLRNCRYEAARYREHRQHERELREREAELEAQLEMALERKAAS